MNYIGTDPAGSISLGFGNGMNGILDHRGICGKSHWRPGDRDQ